MLTEPLSATTLLHGIRMEVMAASHADALAAGYRRNRTYLAPWEPLREESFYSSDGQKAVIEAKLLLFRAGTEVPWVLAAGERIIGTVTLAGIVRGPFQSANLGYWIDGEYAGRGIGTAAVAAVLEAARERLGLHRVQAATLPHNVPSQRILERLDFERIGLAPRYLRIAGQWQDHVLFQRILQGPL